MSIDTILEAIERLGDELAARSPEDLSFRVQVPDDPPAVKVLAELINEIGTNVDDHVKREAADIERRSAELSEAYNALQRQREEMQKDLRMARGIQLRLLPQIHEYPNRQELSCSGYYESMQNVGGDIYDIMRIGLNAYGVLIADVSGHGVPAALITSLVKIAFRTRAHWGVSPDETCRLVNAGLHPILSDLDYFVTAFFGILDLETAEFRYCNAGHHPVLLLRRGESGIISLDTNGKFLGPFPDPVYESGSIVLQDKDILFLYTDGIIESRNFLDEEYGFERLKNCLATCREAAASWTTEEDRAFGSQSVIDAVRRDMLNFTMGAEQRDDQSMFALNYHGPLVERTPTNIPLAQVDREAELLETGLNGSGRDDSGGTGEVDASSGTFKISDEKLGRLTNWFVRKRIRHAEAGLRFIEADALCSALLLMPGLRPVDYALAARIKLRRGDKDAARELLASAERLAGGDAAVVAVLSKIRKVSDI